MINPWLFRASAVTGAIASVRMVRPALLVLAVAITTACATPPNRAGSRDTDIAALRQEVETLKRQVAVLHRRLETAADSRANAARPPMQQSVSFAGNPVLGNSKAKIAMVEFSDYECPFCQRFHTRTFDQIKQKYIDTGRLRYVYRDFPLPSHRRAAAAAVAANCAGEQGGYWAMQRALFSSARQLQRSFYLAQAEVLKLDLKRFEACLGDQKQREEVERDLRYGAQLGIRGTPAFFIGVIQGEQIVDVTPVIGAQPFAVFARAIDRTVKRASERK